jgi:hypothetical protein
MRKKLNNKDVSIKQETHSFYENADKFLSSLKDRITVKGKEYAVDGDPFFNFKEGVGFMSGDEKEVLWSYMTKHLVSIKNHCNNKIPLTENQLDEKCGDIIAYCTLLRFLK